MKLRIFQAFPSEQYCIFLDLGKDLFAMLHAFNNEEDAQKYIETLQNANNLD